MFVATMGAASVQPLAVSAAAKPETKISDHSGKPTYLFFNASEAEFIGAACERLIPVTDDGVGALAAGVPNYLDQQLGDAWGAGEWLYRSGPWINGRPSQGYQLPFTPEEPRVTTGTLGVNRSRASVEAACCDDTLVQWIEPHAHGLVARLNVTSTWRK